MLLSFALYSGLLLIFLAVIGAIFRRTRRTAASCAAAGLLLVVAAVVWPPGDGRASGGATHLDRAMPEWQFREQHAMDVAAPPQRVFDSIRPVTANEILLFRTLTAIRRFGRPMPPNILNAPQNEPLLDIATRTSFRYVAIDPPRELVVETVIVRPRRAVAAMNFLVTADGRGGSVLSTETRVFATDPAAVRAFTVYWRFVQPGSDIIRRMWLRAIRRRAEGQR